MTVVLTGDLHHMGMGTNDQRHLAMTEGECAVEFAEIARTHGVAATLFLTGRLAVEEPRVCQVLSRDPNIEIGGHGYTAFQPKWLHDGIFRRLFGTSCGPAWFQARDIRRTIDVLHGTTGRRILSWRGHAYRHDRRTARLLSDAGIIAVSNTLGSGEYFPRPLTTELVEFPINVIPDHEYIAHGATQMDGPGSRARARHDFSDVLLSADDWLVRAKEQISHVVASGGTATILAHPACMQLVDSFATFRKLCEFLKGHRTVQISKVALDRS